MFENLTSYLQESYLGVVVFRLVLAFIAGGIVGAERGIKDKAAGLRTHMLVSVGSTVIMMTNIFIYELYPSGDVDPTRLGAQVISGIGFLGAGTILVTSDNQISGLTTAAGLWATAAIGLSTGAGLYILSFGGIFSMVIITSFLKPMKSYILDKKNKYNFSLNIYSTDGTRAVFKVVNRVGAELIDLNVDNETIYHGEQIATIFSVTVSLKDGFTREEFIKELRLEKGIKFVNTI